jgi:hypothetical protein
MKIFNTQIGRVLMFVMTLSVSSFSAKADIILSFDTSASDVTVGDTLTVDLLATTQVPGDAFAGWGLDLNYDTSLLSLDSFSIGSSFTALTSSDGDDFAGSYLDIFDPFAAISGTNIVLASFTFTAIAIGNTNLLTGSTLTDLGEGFVSGFFQEVSFANASTNISITDASAVSAPSTIGLFAVAVLGIAGFRRKA